jgi:hypothetical protein
MDFKYLGETGLSGRDSSLMYKDGFFYMLTTATEKEQFAINVYKSKDLVHWTDSVHCRYEITDVEDKRGGKVYNWGPKWVEDGDYTYVIVSLESSQERITHGLLPFKSYPIMDTYIIPVEGWGTGHQQEDLNVQNIDFGIPKKVNWGEGEGLSYKIYQGKQEQISRIGGYVYINGENKEKYGFNYILFVKVDPWGDIEIWGSDDLNTDDAWTRISKFLKYSDPKAGTPSNFIEKVEGQLKFRRLFEGNYPVQIGNQVYLYTDNYSYKATNFLSDGGMYYTTTADFREGFSEPQPIRVTNTNARPPGIQNYVTRNGTVKKVTESAAKKVISNFSKLHTTKLAGTDPADVRMDVAKTNIAKLAFVVGAVLVIGLLVFGIVRRKTKGVGK